MLIKDGQTGGLGKGGQELDQASGWWQGQIFGVVNEVADVNQGPHSHNSPCLETLLCGSRSILQGVGRHMRSGLIAARL